MTKSISTFTRRACIAALFLGAAPLVAAAPPAPAQKPANPAPPGAVPAPPAVPPAVSAPAAAAAPVVQPPDGKWLKDKEGRQYFVEKLPKEGLRYLRLSKDRIRTPWGIEVEIVKEDDKAFYYKVYRPVAGTGPAAGQPVTSPEDAKKIAASYDVDTPESQRLAFVPFSTGLPTSGQWRNGFDLADMNGDGKLDIVHSPARKLSSPPVIFLGDGKGNWRRWTEARYPALPYDYGDAAVGDFNGDGHPDIALGVHLRGLMALLNDGKGTFTDGGKGLDFVLPGQGRDLGFSSRTVLVTDWNHDGRPDILAVGEGPRLNLTPGNQARPNANNESYGVIVYLNQGNGTWLRKDQGTSSRELFSDVVTVGDFNGDHRRDFATGTSVQGRKGLVNLGRQDGGWNPADLTVLRPSSYIQSVDALDLDGDGLDDLVIGYLSYEGETWRNGIDLLYSHKDGSWTRKALTAREGRTEVSSLTHGDLDGDGKTDLVALTGDGETWIFRNDGKGGFSRETATGIKAIPGGCKGYHVRLADFDGDGREEIVADFAGEASAMGDPDRCPSGGGIQAWHLAPAGGPAAPK